MSNTFKYFAYGSNLLKERIQLKNPSAKFISIAKLENYHIGFDSEDVEGKYWRGSGATILSTNEAEKQVVWGCLWTIHNDHLQTLDDQEGVSAGVYRPLQVEVTTPQGETHLCRTYQLLIDDAKDKRPSPQYLDVILRGAKQNELPEDYIGKLESIEHNGNTERVQVYEDVLALIGGNTEG